LDILLQSMQEVVRYNPDILLVIAGSLPRGESFQPYSEIIEKLNLSENVKTFIEYIPEEDVDFYMAACDMVILPYLKFESQSGVLFRAYAHKKPVTASDTGAIGEIVRSDKTGEIAEPGNVKSLSLAINAVLKNINRYQSRYTPELERKYDWEHIGKLTLQSYEKAIALKKNQ
jgi:glycosyltransferase involved in cell wall biosynthesis